MTSTDRKDKDLGIRDSFSNMLYRIAEKRGLVEDIYSQSIRYGGIFVNNQNILSSSDVYELMQDISNQIALADIVVEDNKGKEIDDPALKYLKNPNNYLTQFEFMKLMTNNYLLNGEVFPIKDGDQIHLASNVYTELDNRLIRAL